MNAEVRDDPGLDRAYAEVGVYIPERCPLLTLLILLRFASSVPSSSIKSPLNGQVVSPAWQERHKCDPLVEYPGVRSALSEQLVLPQPLLCDLQAEKLQPATREVLPATLYRLAAVILFLHFGLPVCTVP